LGGIFSNGYEVWGTYEFIKHVGVLLAGRDKVFVLVEDKDCKESLQSFKAKQRLISKGLWA
jgi:hypothetical protein